MSTNTIPERQDGTTIFASWANDIRTAIYGDFVPRNTSAVATDQAGSLGSTSFKWLSAYLHNLYIYNSTLRTRILRASGGANYDLTLPNDYPSFEGPLKVSTSGIVSYDLTGNSVLSGSSGAFSGTYAVYTDVTNLDVTINRNGRPVFLLIVGDSSSTNVQMSAGANNATVRFVRNNATILCDLKFTFADQHAPGSYNYVDTSVTTGSTSYKLQVLAPTGTSFLVNLRLVAVQL